MAAIFGTLFFMAVMAVSVWSIVDSVRPRLGRIAFLLQYGPVGGAELPPAPRVTLRGRQVPMRMVMPDRLRAAA
ncbi:MAG: hypothetical protein ACAH11_09150 [Sphingomonas sp.]